MYQEQNYLNSKLILKIGPTDLPLDSIIYGNNEYDEIEGYVGDENSSNSLIITSEIGKVSIKTKIK